MEENKSDFLEKTLALFIENGAKALTMDDIAKTFSISKKTLYEHYGNKDGLLEQVLRYKLYQVLDSIQEMDKKSSNAIEGLFLKDECLEQASDENKTIFIKQLMKYYPKIFHVHMLDSSEQITKVLVKNVIKGREQGVFRNDFDEEWYAKLFFQLMMSYESTPFIDVTKFNKKDYSNEVVMFYLHAITTEKGKQILNQYHK